MMNNKQVMLNGVVVNYDHPDLKMYWLLFNAFYQLCDVVECIDNYEDGPLSDEEFWG